MQQEYDLKWLFDNFSACSISTGAIKDKKVFIELPFEIFKQAIEIIKERKQVDEILNKIK